MRIASASRRGIPPKSPDFSKEHEQNDSPVLRFRRAINAGNHDMTE